VTAQANTAVWFGDRAAVPVVEPPRTQVHVDGCEEPRIRLDWLETELGGVPRARFSAGLGRDPVTGDEVRLEDLAGRIRPGSSVSVTLLRGGTLPGADRNDLVLFEGRVSRLQMHLDPGSEGLSFEAEDPAAEVLRRRVGGQRVWTGDGIAGLVDGLPLVLNPDGRPNASPDPYDPGAGDPYTIFAPTSPGGAVAWTLDEAVAYLLAEYGASSAMAVPAPGEVRAILGPPVVRDVNLEGRTLGEALAALLELAGGRWSVSVEPLEEGVSRRLEIWLPGRTAAGWLSHQPVGGTFDPSATHFACLAAEMRFEDAPRRYVARGDTKVYESTFNLVAGWDDALASNDPDDFDPAMNPDFVAVRDVFRKWVLNEAGEYSQAPYSRGAAADLADLFEGGPYVRRHRRFLNCLSRDALGRSLGVYAEISLDEGSTWERLTPAARVLAGECGLYLTDAPLSSRYLAAAMRGQARVRVTAAIESDACLTAERVEPGADSLPGRTRHVHVPAGYRFRRRAASSLLAGQTAADEVDDTARLQELVDAVYAADRPCPVPVRITIPYLAMGHRVGRRLLGIRGRRLDLARTEVGYECAPVVRRVRHTFAPAPQTELELD
jgi:hypothetical protein